MKEKKAALKQKIFISLFVISLSVPFVLFNVFSKQLSTDNHENRFLTTLPDVLSAPIGRLPTALDAFFTDNSPFRYQLTALNAEINYQLFHSIDSTQVLLGKEGWLYYKTGPDGASPLADYQGMLTYTEEQLSQYAAAVRELDERLWDNGQTLILNFTPNKDTIYPEYLPDGYPVLHRDKLTDQVVAYLRENTDAIVIYTPEELQAHSKEMQLYFKYDTHWNSVGAMLALHPIFRELGIDCKEFEDYEYKVGGSQEGDMANVAALYNVLKQEDDYLPRDYGYSADARSIQVFGDSFSEYYMFYIANRFQDYGRSALSELTPETALGCGKNIVLVEANERSVQALFSQLCPDADTNPIRR